MKSTIFSVFLLPGILAIPTLKLNKLSKRDFPIPDSTGSVTFDKPQQISGVFDGELKTYGRGVTCTGDDEGGESDTVFVLADGATLKNAIIGPDQIEGVYCKGACTIENVWWVEVCEDALSIKGDGAATIIGGGAQKASDKIIQHNGVGAVTIDGFTANDFGKLYRSCGNCSKMGRRDVTLKNIRAFGGKSALVGINSNFGDIASIDSSNCASNTKVICQEFEGNDNGDEPGKIGDGPSDHCVYSDPLPSC